MLVLSAILIGWLTMGKADAFQPSELDGATLSGGGDLSRSPDVSISMGQKIALTGESEVKLQASDGAEFDRFGRDVSLSGDLAVVGALRRGFKIFSSGAAYVYRLNGPTWQEEAKLTASDGTAEDQFGSSVSVSGDVVLVGADRANDDLSGAAYVYRWDGANWQEEAKLLASAPSDRFGVQVAVSGDVALVGATGGIYVFRWNGTEWAEEAKLTPDDGAEVFGGPISLSGSVAVIGTSADDENGENSGAVYLYRFSAENGWQQEQKLVANDGNAEDYFGGSVSVSGDLLIVGADLDDDSGTDSGSAYLFRKNLNNQWLQEQKLVASDGVAFDFFGSSVSIDGQMALVGSLGNQAGKAYVYRLADNGWQEQVKLTPSDGSQFNLFASSLFLSGSIALVGAPQQDDQIAGRSVGAAYLYNLSAKNEAEITLNPTSIRRVVASSPPQHWGGIKGGATTTDTLSIGNGGTERLNWSFSNLPSWLTATPSQGTLAPDEQQSVTIIFSENLQLRSYTDTLTITSNDPDEANLQVPISLKVMPPESKLSDSEPDRGDSFGFSLSVDGEVLLVGIPGDDFNGEDAGSAIAYRWNGESWQQEQKLGGNDPSRSDAFGRAVSISGNVALVGDPRDNQNGDFSGAAYVLRWDESFSTWHGEAKLVASDSSQFDGFGSSVSVSRDWAIIGAPGGNGIISGSAYLFHWNGTTWQEEAILTSDGNELNNFGRSVSMSGDVALVGTPVEGKSSYVYVYRRDGNNWQREAKLSPNDGGQSEQFGASVSLTLNGDVALIGASGYESSLGAAYLFRFDGNSWQQEAKLLPSDENSQKYFGSSVSIVGEMALVGAPNDNENSFSSGAAYLFRQNGNNWQEEMKILATDGASQDYFGASVALSKPTERSSRTIEANRSRAPVLPFDFLPQPIERTWKQMPLPPEMALIGAPEDDEHGEGSGSLYQYDLSLTVPEITVSPANLSVALVEGTSRHERLTIHNNSTQTISWQYPKGRLCAPSCGSSSWLNVTPITGTIAPNQSQALTVQLNTTNLARGSYSDTLTITSSLSDSPNSQVLIELTVTPPESQLLAGDGAAAHEFGQAVSMGGGYALIGATPDAFDSQWPGAAYLYSWNGRRWQEETTIVASDGSAGDAFGRAVGVSVSEVSGSLMVVGAPFDDDKGENAGAAYLYIWDGTNLTETKVTASDGAAGDHFGLSLSIQGEFAFIGAPFDDNSGDNSGSVYVFRFNNGNWEEESKLLASDKADSFDYFGSSVNLSGQTALVGAVGEQNDDSNGAAYIYRWNGTTWEQEEKLVARKGGHFAGATALAPNVALIANSSDNNNGSAYFFRFNGTSWVEEAFFVGDNAGVDAFGTSVALSGVRALIGAKEEENGRGAAMAYRWNGSTWQQETLLKATDRAEDDKFGSSVAMSGEMALISAPKEDQQGENSGAAYMYDLSIDEIKLVASEGSQGIDLNWNVVKPLAGDLAFYNIYRSVGDGETSLLYLTVGSQHTDISVAQTEGVQYCYHIEAVNSPQESMIGDSNVACVRYGAQELFLPIVIR
jgi:hypothetical protein